jgi:hypothetical protein
MPLPFLAPSLVALRAEFNARFPGRDKASDGWIGDAAHSARESDHNPDEEGMVHALDLDEDTDGNPTDTGGELSWFAEHLRTQRDPRVKYVIYEGQIFAGRNGPSPWVWRTYVGTNLHRKHLHVSVVYDAVGETDQSPWLPPLPAPPLPQEDLMPFPVIGAPTDQTQRPWRALLPGKVITFVDWDPLPAGDAHETFAPGWAYYSGGACGVFQELRRCATETEYDQACAVAQQYTQLPSAAEPGPAGPPGPPGPAAELPAVVPATIHFDQE